MTTAAQLAPVAVSPGAPASAASHAAGRTGPAGAPPPRPPPTPPLRVVPTGGGGGWAWRYACISALSGTFGVSVLCARTSLVSGEVSCRCSHASIWCRSYVCPHAAITGSDMISCEIGQTK